MEQQLLQRELDKQKLIGQATIETQEQERSEIGRELHDNVNQVLTTTKLYLDLSLSNPELKDELIEKSSKNVIYVINEIRQLSRSLMNPSLGDLGLIDSIHDLIENINITRKLHVTLKAGEELEDKLSENQKLTLFRIIQEALNNAIKHAKATNVFINLYESKSNLFLTINDDGVGFEPVSVKKGSGLKNIQNRVYLANGTISLESTPGKGCNIEITFPITNNNPN
jgi:signal transduction histidine kinase